MAVLDRPAELEVWLYGFKPWPAATGTPSRIWISSPWRRSLVVCRVPRPALTGSALRELVEEPATAFATAWPLRSLHSDPFDHLVLAQAEREGLQLITADPLVGPLSGSGAPSGLLLSRPKVCVVQSAWTDSPREASLAPLPCSLPSPCLS